MPDITMCHGERHEETCPLRETCYRHTATPSPYRQAYFETPPVTAVNGQAVCDYHARSEGGCLTLKEPIGLCGPCADRSKRRGMTTAEKCEMILREIVRRCNYHIENRPEIDPTEQVIGFGPDWGGNALTVYLDGSHTHVGYTEATFDVLVTGLYRLLGEGVGLSLASSIEPKKD